MAEIDSPLGSEDATEVIPATREHPARHRVGHYLADPYVEAARLRLASVDGTYRLPTSNPAISDELVTMNATLAAQTNIAGTLGAIYEQNERILMMLESIAE